MLETLSKDPLIDALRSIQNGHGDDFWSFKNMSKRTGAHALIQYPAMMVPTLQGHLLDAIKETSSKEMKVLDPFVGSGTILVESMNRGLDFTGIDINPLAILACEVKSGPYFHKSLVEKSEELIARIQSDKSKARYVTFENQEKWFNHDVTVNLSKISRNIEEEGALWARKLFWLALTKVIRQVCNSRGSTYKLHIKKDTESSSNLDAIGIFEKTLTNFAGHIKTQAETWTNGGYLNKGRHTSNIEVLCGDNSKRLCEEGYKNQFDIVMTSPPYGDNQTTIPYGQFSHLPLQWIATDDISNPFDQSMLAGASSIDSASLGGSLKGAIANGEKLTKEYPSAMKFSKQLGEDHKGLKKFYSFFSDFENSVENICNVTSNGGYQSWTIANRRIGGISVPMEDLLGEMLEKRNLNMVGKIHRNILVKRMAPRNNYSETMSKEVILMAKKYC